MKNENRISLNFQDNLKILRNWILATRPKTLIAGISPVWIGSSVASLYHPISLSLFFHCLFFSIFLQIASNWANDYYDFQNGADTEARKGPPRAVQSGWIRPITMKNAAYGSLVLSFFTSIPLILHVGVQYLPIVIISMACAIYYSKGIPALAKPKSRFFKLFGCKRPLGYIGFGDALVILFYGPIATCGSCFVQLHFIPKEAWIASFIPGLLSCAILCINNLRDIPEDRLSHKMTLAARFGERFAKIEYTSFLLLMYVTPLLLVAQSIFSFFLLFLTIPLAMKPLKIVLFQSNNLNRALEQTAQLLALNTLLFWLCIHAYLHL